MKHTSLYTHGLWHQWFSWGVCVCVCVCVISKGIYQRFVGVTDNSFKICQEILFNSLKVTGSINVFSVPFLNLFFYACYIFLWESRNLLLWNLKCSLIRLALHIVYVGCFTYKAISLPSLSFLVRFKATLWSDETQPLSPGRLSLTWLLMYIYPHLWKSTTQSYPVFFPFCSLLHCQLSQPSISHVAMIAR